MEKLYYGYAIWLFFGILIGLYLIFFKNRTAVYLRFGDVGVFVICLWFGPLLLALVCLIKLYNLFSFVTFYCQIWFWLMYYERRNPVSAARYARKFGYSTHFTPKEAVYTNWIIS